MKLSLGIGGKIILALSSILIVCMLISTFVVTSFLRGIQEETANKLLVNAAKREAYKVEGVFNDIYTALNASRHLVARDVYRGNIAYLEQDVMDILNSNGAGAFGWLILKDSRFRGEHIDAKYRLPNGDFMILAVNDDEGDVWKSHIGTANETIANFKNAQNVLSTGKPSVGRPLWTKIDGKEFFGVGIGQPIVDERGTTIGVLGVFIDLLEISNDLQRPDKAVFKGDFKGIYATDSTIAAHGRKEFLGLYLREVNQSPSMNELKHMIENQIEGESSYINSLGELSHTAVTTIEVGNKVAVWTLIVSAPESSIYAAATKARWILIIANILVVIIIAAGMMIFTKLQITSRLKSISSYLFRFLKVVNHESQTFPPRLNLNSNDEFGIMAKEINQNIENIQHGLEKDQNAIAQSAQTAKAVE
ncbi:PDC sensor domain-containing protein, partial [Helicobacter sp.]|uniref:PDC sensor domain-containing protein n=1 Tax=Helicobacter sp. TaxID=218 RepID=UPI00198F8BC9